MKQDEACAWCGRPLFGLAVTYPIGGPVACCSEPCLRAFYRAVAALVRSNLEAAGVKVVPA